MEQIQHFAKQSMKQNAPVLRAGETVRVHQKIREGNKERIQVFEGLVISVRGSKAINSSFVVRRIASGVGVERTFPLHSPNVVKVERVKAGKVRQSKLFYMRERFGRNARLRNEIASKETWEEPTVVAEELPVEEPVDNPEASMDARDDAPVELAEDVAQDEDSAEGEAESTEEVTEDEAPADETPSEDAPEAESDDKPKTEE